MPACLSGEVIEITRPEGAGRSVRIAVQTGKFAYMFRCHREFIVRVCALFALLLASPAAAHENHNQLGAGPGPAVEEGSRSDKATSPAVANMHENMADAHEEAMEDHHAAADENRTFGQRLVSWLGRLHTLVIHFPIAMFVGALGVELYGAWRKDRSLEGAARVMLVIGAIGAIAAAALGWFAGGFYLTDRNVVLMIHRWLGTAIALFGIVLVYAAARAHRAAERPRTPYWAFLGLMTLAIAVQGYLGGTFMHGGMDHMAF